MVTVFVLCKCLKDGVDRENSDQVYAASDVSTRVDVDGWSTTLIVETFAAQTFVSQKTSEIFWINFRELESRKMFAR